MKSEFVINAAHNGSDRGHWDNHSGCVSSLVLQESCSSPGLWPDMTGRGGPTELRERPGFLALCGHMGPVFSFQNRLTPFKRNHENESRSGSGGGEAETQFPSCSVRLLWPGIPQLHDTNKGCLRVLMFLGAGFPWAISRSSSALMPLNLIWVQMSFLRPGKASWVFGLGVILWEVSVFVFCLPS